MSNSRQAWASVVLGALALGSIPAGTLLAGRVVSVSLVRATLVAVVAAIVFGLIGFALSRRARFRVERSLSRRGARITRLGRFLVLAGLYLGVIGAIALGFYGVVLAFS